MVLILMAYVLLDVGYVCGDSVGKRISGMKDNSWMKIDTPEQSPETRGYSPFMPYAPDMRKAFLYGASHGGQTAQNDVWLYDMERNNWKQAYEPDPGNWWKGDKNEAVVVDGVLMTRNGRPYTGHTRYHHTYMPGVGLIEVRGSLGGRISHILEKSDIDASRIHDKVVAAIFDPLQNRWRYRKGGVEAPGRNTGFIVFQYIPALKKCLALTQRQTWFYDPITNVWERTDIISPPNAGDSLASYDASEKALLFYEKHGGGNPVMQWAYFVDKKIWKKLDTDVIPGEAWVGARSHLNYDSTNNVHVMFKIFGEGPVSVWIFDLKKQSWTEMPHTSPWPENLGVGESYYDPMLNAFLLYVAPDEGKGQTWLYRFRKSFEAKEAPGADGD